MSRSIGIKVSWKAAALQNFAKFKGKYIGKFSIFRKVEVLLQSATFLKDNSVIGEGERAGRSYCEFCEVSRKTAASEGNRPSWWECIKLNKWFLRMKIYFVEYEFRKFYIVNEILRIYLNCIKNMSVVVFVSNIVFLQNLFCYGVSLQ